MNKWLLKFMEQPDISDNTDISDRFELLDKKMEYMPGGGPDKTDKFDPNLNMSVLSGHVPELLRENFPPYGEYDFDERLSIAEYEGGQSPTQAQKTAYLDAFISVLTSLPATASQRDWLGMRIQTALAWIEAQDYRTIN